MQWHAVLTIHEVVFWPLAQVNVTNAMACRSALPLHEVASGPSTQVNVNVLAEAFVYLVGEGTPAAAAVRGVAAGFPSTFAAEHAAACRRKLGLADAADAWQVRRRLGWRVEL